MPKDFDPNLEDEDDGGDLDEKNIQNISKKKNNKKK